MAGWDELGRVLGGGLNTEAAYQRGQTRAAQLEGLIAQARIKKSEADARANLPGALTKLDAPADLATLFAAGIDPRQLSGYTKEVQEQGFRGDAASRALAGDWGGANAALMGVASGPQQLAKIEGQNLLSNVFLEGGGGISTTEQGRADIRQSDASAAASRASAANSYASADSTRRRAALAENQFALQRAGQWNPGGAGGGAAGGAGGGAAAVKTTEDERKAAGWLGQATRALENMDAVMYQRDSAGNIKRDAKGQPLMSGADTPGFLERYSPSDELANWSMSPDRQRYSNAAGSLSEALLRAATGAGINESEAKQKVVELTPQRGDSLAVREQKMAGARGYLEDLRLRAGRALPAAGDVFSGAAPTPSAAPVQRATNPTTGQILELRNGQWVPAR